jgi:hypothetical protein
MRIRVELGRGGRALVGVLASLSALWVGTSPGASEALARFGINFTSRESAGIPGGESLGLRRELVVESHGAGRADLQKRRFVARQGQVLVLDYEAAVAGGYLVLSVNRLPSFSDGLWARPLHADRRETVRLAIPRTGVYQLTATQYRHTGRYRVGWWLE